MPEAVIGALRVNMGIDTAEFSRGMQAVEGRLSRFQGLAKASGAIIGTALVAGLAGVASAIGDTIDEMDKMGKMAQSIGLPVDQLVRLKYAAELSDVSVETLAKAVVKLNDKLVEAATDGGSSAAKTFEALKIKVQNADGSVRDAIDAMADIGDRFVSFEDGALKSAAAGELFGKKLGANLIPMLNQGGDALRNTMVEADKFRFVYDAETAAAAEQFNDDLTRLSGAAGILTGKLTAALLPALATYSSLAVQAAQSQTLFAVGTNVASGAITALIPGLSTAIRLYQHLKQLLPETSPEQTIGPWVTTIQGMTAEEQAYLDALIAAQTAERERQAIMEEGRQVTLGVRTEQEVLNDRIARLGELLKAGAIDWATYVQATAQANDELRQISAEALSAEEQSLMRRNEAMGKMGMAVPLMDAYRQQLVEIGILERQGAIDADLAAQARVNAANELVLAQTAAIQQAGLALAPMQAYQAQLAQISQLETQGAIDAQTAAQARLAAAAQVASSWAGLASNIAGSLGALFRENKAFAIAEAVINTAQAITRTMAEYGFTPYGIAAMAAAALAGAAQIATITRAQPGSAAAPKASSSGSVPKAGSSGGSSGAAAAAAQRQTVFLNIHSTDPAGIRATAEALGQYMRDGGTDMRIVD